MCLRHVNTMVFEVNLIVKEIRTCFMKPICVALLYLCKCARVCVALFVLVLKEYFSNGWGLTSCIQVEVLSDFVLFFIRFDGS